MQGEDPLQGVSTKQACQDCMCTPLHVCESSIRQQCVRSACSGGVALWHARLAGSTRPDQALRDWLRRAGRPRFVARTREDAEDFFISSLARWRDALGLGKVRSATAALSVAQI